jgi:hypothetical protein
MFVDVAAADNANSDLDEPRHPKHDVSETPHNHRKQRSDKRPITGELLRVEVMEGRRIITVG